MDSINQIIKESDYLKTSYTEKQKTDNQKGYISLLETRKTVENLPFDINPQFIAAVCGYLRFFGEEEFLLMADIAVDKRNPERYFMTMLKNNKRQAESSL